MNAIHKDLAAGRWAVMTSLEQLGNIGSEVERGLRWQQKGDDASAQNAIYRALDLIDLTVADEKWRFRLKELLRMREVLCDYFFGANIYSVTADMLRKDFLSYGIAARAGR